MITNYIHNILTHGLANFEVGFVLVNLLRLLIALAVYYTFLSHKLRLIIHHNCFQ
jgi:hypothetical protein